MELEYDFEETEVLAGGGVMAWGKAYIRQNSTAYPEHFHVAAIAFAGDKVVRRIDIAEKRATLQELSMAELIFNVVAHKIETSTDAQEAWDEYRSEWDA